MTCTIRIGPESAGAGQDSSSDTQLCGSEAEVIVENAKHVAMRDGIEVLGEIEFYDPKATSGLDFSLECIDSLVHTYVLAERVGER